MNNTVAVPPPTRHQLAVMIWLAVLPTLLVLNYALGSVGGGWPIWARTFVVATVAVPIVIYGVMPQLQRVRGRLVATRITSTRR
jgi:antibiotic biosynthesis monooxygenase (ABM) superfamily enzyme